MTAVSQPQITGFDAPTVATLSTFSTVVVEEANWARAWSTSSTPDRKAMREMDLIEAMKFGAALMQMGAAVITLTVARRGQ